MSQPRQFQMMICNNPSQYNDTTFTKIFVGGLAWETQRDNLRRYFEQFGEILEAVVISDKYNGRSKGYGFVTFKDPEAAMRACQNPSPVIDGRRANCNLASLGAQKHRQSTPQNGPIKFRATPGLVAQSVHQASSSIFFHQPTGQYTFPCSTYGYTGYSQDSIHAMNYYSVYDSQQSLNYISASAGASGAAGMFQNLYPMYAQYAQRSQAYAFGVQYPPIVQYPYLPQHYGSSTGILSLPSSLAMIITTGGTPATVVTTTSTVSSQTSGTDSEQNSSST